jgi:hypothetical protein
MTVMQDMAAMERLIQAVAEHMAVLDTAVAVLV